MTTIRADIEHLLKALGAGITEGRVSRARVVLNGEKAVFLRLRPERITDRGQMVSVKRFLENAGLGPDEEGADPRVRKLS